MHRDLQIIGDRIEFMGYTVGKIEHVPASIRARFIALLETGAIPQTMHKLGERFNR
jgi:hypothetical protein